MLQKKYSSESAPAHRPIVLWCLYVKVRRPALKELKSKPFILVS